MRKGGYKAQTQARWGDSISRLLTALVIIVSERPARWLCGLLVLTAILSINLISVRVDTSLEGYLHPNSPVITQYESFKSLFGEDKIFFILIETDDLLEPSFLQQFRRLHQALEDGVPNVDRVDSLINARHTYSLHNELIIEELLREDPQSPQALEDLKQHVYSNPAYQNTLISADRRLVTLAVKLLPFVERDGEIATLDDGDLRKASQSIDDVLAPFATLFDDIQVAGGPKMQLELGDATERDFAVFSGLANGIVCLVLLLIFRRMSGVVMPMLVMGLAVAATISTMTLLNVPLQMTTSIIPSFLLAVCIGDSVHLLSAFYRRFDANEEKLEALTEAVGDTGQALFFTTITTATGLAAFSGSGLFIVANLGIFAAVGVVFAFIYTLIAIPALIMLLPLQRRVQSSRRDSFFTCIVRLCTRLSTQYPMQIAISGVLVLAVCLLLSLQLGFSQNSLTWLPEDNPTRLAMSKVRDRLGGMIPIEVLVDSKEEGGITNPQLLKKLDASLQEIAQWGNEDFKVAKTLGLSDMVKEAHQALNNNDGTYFKIPNEKMLIRQEILLMEMDAPEYLFEYTDSRLQLARNTFLVPWLDAVNYGKLSSDIQRHFQENYPDVQLEVTGIALIMSQAFVEMLYTTRDSYGLAFVMISVMMIFVLGNLRLGLISMIPNMLPIVIVLAVMKLVNLPLDMFTMLIGSIALGITVDDTVHFMIHFKRYYARHGDVERAVFETLDTAGRAMAITTLVLALGFLVYTQSALANLASFGLLTALCVSLALCLDFILAPALVVLVVSRGRLGREYVFDMEAATDSLLVEDDQATLMQAEVAGGINAVKQNSKVEEPS